MKNQVILLTLSFIVLFIFGCSTFDEEPQIQSVQQNENLNIQYSKLIDYLKKLDNSDKGPQNRIGENHGKGVYFVPYSSNLTDRGGTWIAVVALGNNMLMVSDYPKNGEDRALLFPDDGIMINFTVHNPKLFILHFPDGPGSGYVKYSNRCEENATGLYRERLRSGGFIPLDFDGDGEIDVYFIDFSKVKEEGSMLNVKATLTDAQISGGVFPGEGDCREPTEEVEFSLYLGPDGPLRVNFREL